MPYLRERPQERGQEHSLAVRCLARKPPRAVQRDHRLARSRPSAHACRTVEVSPDDCPLGRVQVHHPLLDRAVEQPADLPLALGGHELRLAFACDDASCQLLLVDHDVCGRWRASVAKRVKVAAGLFPQVREQHNQIRVGKASTQRLTDVDARR